MYLRQSKQKRVDGREICKFHRSAQRNIAASKFPSVLVGWLRLLKALSVIILDFLAHLCTRLAFGGNVRVDAAT